LITNKQLEVYSMLCNIGNQVVGARLRPIKCFRAYNTTLCNNPMALSHYSWDFLPSDFPKATLRVVKRTDTGAIVRFRFRRQWYITQLCKQTYKYQFEIA
jgi:hypothetical protein